MSYILDALKKAEEERRRGTAPDVTTVQNIRPVERRALSSAWIYLLLAALFLNGGALVWWLGPWNTKRPGMTVQKAKSEAVMSAAGTKDVSDGGPEDVPLPAKKTKTGYAGKVGADRAGRNLPSEKIETAEEVKGRSADSEAGVKTNVAKRPEAESVVKDESEAPAQPIPPAPEANRIYSLNQLPSSVRESLPDLTMSLHYFTDDPSLSLVRINGETLRQGQETAQGLRLEKVTFDGAVFDYRQYRFRVAIQHK